jgi:hypothetical protein
LTETDLLVFGIERKKWILPPVEQQAKVPVEVEELVAPRPAPMALGAKAALNASIDLPALDVESLLAEDEARAQQQEKSAARVGVVRSLPVLVDLTDGQAAPSPWQENADGSRVSATTLSSPDARALRVHFTALRVPDGVRLIIYNAKNANESYGPYTSDQARDTDLWSASCFSDIVTIECYIPAGVDASGLKVTAPEVTHTYVDFGVMQWTKAAGTCNRDVSCYGDWVSASHAVAGFVFVNYPNQLHCTGSLIADTDPGSRIPYFLTANHCVNQQNGSSGASSMEFFWLYQTGACNGTPPLLADCPRTAGGADLLANMSASVGSDFALVRLRNAPPKSLPYLGWSTSAVALGTQVACIHHPTGDFKRISFATTTNTGSPRDGGVPVQPYARFHEVVWNIGTTELGSSGGPLMLAGTQQVIGQLWGGNAACNYPSEPDYFGRFDKSYPVLATWLSPSVIPTDVNKDGSVNSLDLQLVVNAALGIPINASYKADINNSGAVDAVDVQLEILAVLNSGQP